MNEPRPQPDSEPPLHVRSDVPFYIGLGVIGGTYVLLLIGMLVSQSLHTSTDDIWSALQSREIQYAIKLSLISCAITTILSLWVAVPIGYAMCRHNFPGKSLVDAVLDIPIVLPPLVVGLCLIILFNGPSFTFVETQLHLLERWLAGHLVAVAILGPALILALLLFVFLRNWIPKRSYRGLLVGGLLGTAAVVAMWPHFQASMPGWVPVPERFQAKRIELRDQSPLVTSREFYFGRYAFSGSATDLAATIEKTASVKRFHDVRILGSPDSLTKTGRRRYEAVAEKTDTAEIPFDSRIVITIRPKEKLSELRKRKVDFESDSIEWNVTYDVQRLPANSRESFVPKLTLPVTFEIPAVILAQFMVACAFAVRTMRVTFDQLPSRYEDVALTLGCNRSQAFWLVVLPQCRRGMLAAGTLAWARSLGEFGPILIFAGSTRMKTEVLSTTVFLELTVGSIEGAVAASLIMIGAAITVLVIARVFGLRRVAF